MHHLVKLDIFGYPVSLFYHENNRKKNSVLGFFVTVLMFMVAVAYVGFMALRVGDPEYQQVVQTVFNIDLNKEEPMKLSEQELRFFAYFYKDFDQEVVLSDLERYVNISFHHMHENWNNGTVTETNHSAKRCEPQHFGEG